MTYRNAKKLHNEDEVTLKETGEVLTVLQAYEPDTNILQKKAVFIECDDGHTYHHTEIR